MSVIKNKVIEIIEDHLCVNDVKPEDNLQADLGADSLDTIEMLMAAEEDFDIEISDEDGEKIKTVQDAIDYIKGRVE